MISQTTPVKPNRKERRALERKMRKETKNPKTAAPTNETGMFTVYVPVIEQPKETNQPTPSTQPILEKLRITVQEADEIKKYILNSTDCFKTAGKTYGSLTERIICAYIAKYQQQSIKAEAACNIHYAANAIAAELGIPTVKNYLDDDIKASQRNVEEFRSYILALTNECNRLFAKLESSIEKLDSAIFGDTEPWIVSDETINSFKKAEQKRLADLLVEKENRRAEAARQAEIDSLLARLKELGYDPAETKSKPNENEFFVTVERREEVVPVISITLNGEPLTMSVDEAIAEIKRWRANLPKKSSKDNPLDNQDNIDHLRLIEKLSFVKQIDRTSLFKYDFDWSYNTFWYRFKGLVSKYNIKLWCRYKMTFDR